MAGAFFHWSETNNKWSSSQYSHTGAVGAVVEHFVHYIIKFNQFCQNIRSRAKRIPTLFVHWKVQNVSLYHFFTRQNILGLRGRWVYSSNWHISISIETLSWSRSLHFSSAFCQILHSIDSKNCHSSYILIILTNIIITATIIITTTIIIIFISASSTKPGRGCWWCNRWRRLYNRQLQRILKEGRLHFRPKFRIFIKKNLDPTRLKCNNSEHEKDWPTSTKVQSLTVPSCMVKSLSAPANILQCLV